MRRGNWSAPVASVAASTTSLPGAENRLCAAEHPACFACAPAAEGGLGLAFATAPDGSVAATFGCPERFQGYPDRLHGGVVATLLDAAMTHCLFAGGRRGVTAKLEVRFRKPVSLDEPARVAARVVEERGAICRLAATLEQAQQTCAEAEALFALDR